ncbi:YitT family protein [Peptococcus simiae]|uniref:YitT family protein n=1 Tax=Peptococcus simiae TaxID=1643805 RepID=A0ABW9H2Y5_9FIRM
MKGFALRSRAQRFEPASRYLLCIFGAVLYGIGLNIFVGPIHLYMGGVTGIAQIGNTLSSQLLGIQMNMTGYVVFIINIPLLFMAYKYMNRIFFVKTIITIIAEMAAFSWIPIPAAPLLDDPLTLSVIGGIISGFGCGLILRYGGSSGGVDILGVYAAMKNPNISVGTLSLILSALVFVYCAFVYPFETVAYSVIYTLITTFVYEKVYLQNIKVSVLVITKQPEHWVYINNVLQRGATFWRGIGAYSGTDTYIIFSVVSKYEMPILRRYLREKDPNSFMVAWDQVTVNGHFQSHLFS